MYYDLVESGKRIKKLRKEKGLSQNALAETLGIHVKTVSKAERGIIGLSVDNLLILADYFDALLDYLVKGTELELSNNKLIDIIEKMNSKQQEAAYTILESILKFPKF